MRRQVRKIRIDSAACIERWSWLWQQSIAGGGAQKFVRTPPPRALPAGVRPGLPIRAAGLGYSPRDHHRHCCQTGAALGGTLAGGGSSRQQRQQRQQQQRRQPPWGCCPGRAVGRVASQGSQDPGAGRCARGAGPLLRLRRCCGRAQHRRGCSSGCSQQRPAPASSALPPPPRSSWVLASSCCPATATFGTCRPRPGRCCPTQVRAAARAGRPGRGGARRPGAAAVAAGQSPGPAPKQKPSDRTGRL